MNWRQKAIKGIVISGRMVNSICLLLRLQLKVRKENALLGIGLATKILFDGKSVKGEICYSALMVLLPKVYAMRYGVEFPWIENKDVIYNACPDPENPVVFKIHRIRK